MVISSKKKHPPHAPAPSLQDMLAIAIEHHQSENFNEAITIYLKLLAHVPDHPEVNYLYGHALIARKSNGDIERSLSYLETAAQTLNNQPPVMLALAESLMLNKKFHLANEALSKAEALGASAETCEKCRKYITQATMEHTIQERYLSSGSYVAPEFYLDFPDTLSETRFYQTLEESLSQPITDHRIFIGDNLIALSRTLSFLDDAKLIESFQKHTETAAEKATLWRVAVLLWGARQGLNLPGDFVECGCYRGISARIICDVLNFKQQEQRQYYLYDLFEHSEQETTHHAMPAHSSTLVNEVRQRFADMKNAQIIQGRVPDSLHDNMPEKIAFLHIDLNNVAAELGALELLFERLSPGGIMILDDYGWQPYMQQRLQEEPWLLARGHYVLELPTGQGMVIKH